MTAFLAWLHGVLAWAHGPAAWLAGQARTITSITIRLMGFATEIRWDDCSVQCQVSDSGPVRPHDVEVIAGGAS